MTATINARRVYTVLVPWVPPVRLNPNQRTPERTLRRLRNEGRDMAILAIRSAYPGGVASPIAGPCRITYAVHWPNGRQAWDGDNLKSAMKGVRDAFEKERVLVNDRQISTDDVVQVFDGEGVTVVTLLEIGETQP